MLKVLEIHPSYRHLANVYILWREVYLGLEFILHSNSIWLHVCPAFVTNLWVSYKQIFCVNYVHSHILFHLAFGEIQVRLIRQRR